MTRFFNKWLHPTPYSLHPTPYHLTPYTPHPTPYTLHPTPYTLHPTPHTTHQTTYTMQSKPSSAVHTSQRVSTLSTWTLAAADRMSLEYTFAFCARTHHTWAKFTNKVDESNVDERRVVLTCSATHKSLCGMHVHPQINFGRGRGLNRGEGAHP